MLAQYDKGIRARFQDGMVLLRARQLRRDRPTNRGQAPALTLHSALCTLHLNHFLLTFHNLHLLAARCFPRVVDDDSFPFDDAVAFVFDDHLPDQRAVEQCAELAFEFLLARFRCRSAFR